MLLTRRRVEIPTPEDYVKMRAELIESLNRPDCLEYCNAYCCRKDAADLTAIDLILISDFLGEQPETVAKDYLDVLKMKKGSYIMLVTKLPCRFLNGNECSIYPVRPMKCGYFPSKYALREISEKGLYEYKCVFEGFELPEREMEGMNELMHMESVFTQRLFAMQDGNESEKTGGFFRLLEKNPSDIVAEFIKRNRRGLRRLARARPTEHTPHPRPSPAGHCFFQ